VPRIRDEQRPRQGSAADGVDLGTQPEPGAGSVRQRQVQARLQRQPLWHTACRTPGRLRIEGKVHPGPGRTPGGAETRVAMKNPGVMHPVQHQRIPADIQHGILGHADRAWGRYPAQNLDPGHRLRPATAQIHRVQPQRIKARWHRRRVDGGERPLRGFRARGKKPLLPAQGVGRPQMPFIQRLIGNRPGHRHGVTDREIRQAGVQADQRRRRIGGIAHADRGFRHAHGTVRAHRLGPHKGAARCARGQGQGAVGAKGHRRAVHENPAFRHGPQARSAQGQRDLLTGAHREIGRGDQGDGGRFGQGGDARHERPACRLISVIHARDDQVIAQLARVGRPSDDPCDLIEHRARGKPAEIEAEGVIGVGIARAYRNDQFGAQMPKRAVHRDLRCAVDVVDLHRHHGFRPAAAPVFHREPEGIAACGAKARRPGETPGRTIEAGALRQRIQRPEHHRIAVGITGEQAERELRPLAAALRAKRGDHRGGIGVCDRQADRFAAFLGAIGGDQHDARIIARIEPARRPAQEAGFRVKRRTLGQPLGQIGHRVAIGVDGGQLQGEIFALGQVLVAHGQQQRCAVLRPNDQPHGAAVAADRSGAAIAVIGDGQRDGMLALIGGGRGPDQFGPAIGRTCDDLRPGGQILGRKGQRVAIGVGDTDRKAQFLPGHRNRIRQNRKARRHRWGLDGQDEGLFVAADIGGDAAAIVLGPQGNDIDAAIQRLGGEPQGAAVRAGNEAGKAAVRAKDARLDVDADPVGAGQGHHRRRHSHRAAVGIGHVDRQFQHGTRRDDLVFVRRDFRCQVEVGDIQHHPRLGHRRNAGAIAVIGGDHPDFVAPRLIEPRRPEEKGRVGVEHRPLGKAGDGIGHGGRASLVGGEDEGTVGQLDGRAIERIVGVDGQQLQAEGLRLDQIELSKRHEFGRGIGILDGDAHRGLGNGLPVADLHRDVVGAGLGEPGDPFEHPRHRVQRRARRQDRRLIGQRPAAAHQIGITPDDGEAQGVALAHHPVGDRQNLGRGIALCDGQGQRQAHTLRAVTGDHGKVIGSRIAKARRPAQDTAASVERGPRRQVVGQHGDDVEIRVAGQEPGLERLALGSGEGLPCAQEFRRHVAAIHLDDPGDIGEGAQTVENPNHDRRKDGRRGIGGEADLARGLIHGQALGAFQKDKGEGPALGILDRDGIDIFGARHGDAIGWHRHRGRGVQGRQREQPEPDLKMQRVGGDERGRGDRHRGAGRQNAAGHRKVDHPQLVRAGRAHGRGGEIAGRVQQQAQGRHQRLGAGVGHVQIEGQRAIAPVAAGAREFQVQQRAEILQHREPAFGARAHGKARETLQVARDGEGVVARLDPGHRQCDPPRGGVVADIQNRNDGAGLGFHDIVAGVQDRSLGQRILGQHVGIKGDLRGRDRVGQNRPLSGADRGDPRRRRRVQNIDPRAIGDQDAAIGGGDQVIAPCRAKPQHGHGPRRHVQQHQRRLPG